jgi:hypothetical protein
MAHVHQPRIREVLCKFCEVEQNLAEYLPRFTAKDDVEHLQAAMVAIGYASGEIGYVQTKVLKHGSSNPYDNHRLVTALADRLNELLCCVATVCLSLRNQAAALDDTFNLISSALGTAEK